MPPQTLQLAFPHGRGPSTIRRVVPYRSSAERHPEPQRLLDALGSEREPRRTFASANARKWRSAALGFL